MSGYGALYANIGPYRHNFWRITHVPSGSSASAPLRIVASGTPLWPNRSLIALFRGGSSTETLFQDGDVLQGCPEQAYAGARPGLQCC